MMGGFVLTFVLLLMQTAQTAALYEYAAACIPRYYDPEPATCQLHILSNVENDIQIQTFNGTETFTLSAATPYQRDFGDEFIPTDASENKAIQVTSSHEIQVLVHVILGTSNQVQDAYMVPNSIRNNNIYYTSSYVGLQCGSGAYKQFYLVSSIYDETSISITQQDGETFDLELPAFGTFIKRTQDFYDHLAMGTRIVSSKPVTVVAGNLCFANRADSSGSGDAYISSFPEVASLGKEYIVPRIVSDDIDNPAGYSVAVVATEDNTTVISNGEMRSLQQGETTIFEYPLQHKIMYANCSNPCLITQGTKSIRDKYGLFMQHILPLQQFSTSSFFSTSDSHPASFLSLVMEGEAPGNDLLLDGNALGYLTWTVINGYSSAELEISQGVHELVSSNGRPFAAYVYSQLLHDTAASGYALLPLESSRLTTVPPTTIPTMPSPSMNSTLPQHTVRVNGTAFTEDGQDILATCAVAHSNSLSAKTKDMVVRVNAEIGASICLDMEDLMVVSSVASTFNEDNKMMMQVYHILRVLGHHVPDDVETCALEVANYMSDLSNWQQPIFPDVPDCSRLEIRPHYFNYSGTFWKCDNQVDKNELGAANNVLSYSSDVSELFETVDGSSLDAECTSSYTVEASKKTTSMMGFISDALTSSQCDDVVTSVTHAETFVGLGTQAYFQASFYYVPRPSASFAEFIACMQTAHDFNLQHGMWSPGSQPGAPFLPVPPGCPALEHDTDTLDDGGHKWICV